MVAEMHSRIEQLEDENKEKDARIEELEEVLRELELDVPYSKYQQNIVEKALHPPPTNE